MGAVSVAPAVVRRDALSSVRARLGPHRRVFAAVMILTAGALAVLTVWMLPRQATADELQSAMATGSVTGWEFTSATGAGNLFPDAWDFGSSKDSVVDAADATYVVWQTSDLQRHRTAIDGIEVTSAPATGNRGTAVSDWMMDRYAKNPTGAPGSPDGFGPVHWFRLALLLMTFAGCGVWEPRVGSRWFWVWLAAVPLGVGSLAYAVTELVHEPRDRGDRKLRGIVGLMAALAATAAISLTLR